MTKEYPLKEGMIIYVIMDSYRGKKVEPCKVRKLTNPYHDEQWNLKCLSEEEKYYSVGFDANHIGTIYFFDKIEAETHLREMKEKSNKAFQDALSSKQDILKRLFTGWSYDMTENEEVQIMERRIEEEFGVKVR
ncbi:MULTISPECIES: hypothetical protein [unclassified Bacillus (in: firmicutes)]|uniref:hypothetical protein n=1 Tax=unclassified Bacillus (in: firmicutes) TaxID=185979 RepID=UPI003010519D